MTRRSSYFAIEIDAPQLKYMKLKDYRSDKIVLKNLGSLAMIDIATEYSSPLGPMKRVIITDFLISVSSVKHMIISQLTLEIIFRYSKRIPKFDNLYHLQAVFSSSMIHLLPIFLESCPNLKDLILDYYFDGARETELTSVSQCLLSTLECVEIKELLIKEETWKKLARYFLENSVLLKKLILRFNDFSIANQDSDIFQELCTFTKPSQECQIIIHRQCH
ncbi:unnamed protein product [Thlaspi arvense]|uniref:FBD domain-containing protein n=1 Tax=Thlaspi arvense TaxID=13288 RepID=A0AAU9RN77_THLAR|nr:unnamed protein product [Thlaspi arvense]